MKRTRLNAGGRALAAALVCWLPLVALTAMAGTLLGPDGPRALAFDYPVHVRFLLAVPLFFLMDPAAATRLGMLLRHFVGSGLIAQDRVGEFNGHVRATIRRRDAWQAEAILAIAALGLSVLAVRTAVHHRDPSWIGAVADGAVRLTPAGWWLMVAATPLFLFLVGRWLWRYLLWARLLSRIAKMDLCFAVTHPDKTGGVAFIAQYPSVFTSFILAVTSVAAARAADALIFADATIGGMKVAMIAWIVIVIAIFVARCLPSPLRSRRSNATPRSATPNSPAKPTARSKPAGPEMTGLGLGLELELAPRPKPRPRPPPRPRTSPRPTPRRDPCGPCR